MIDYFKLLFSFVLLSILLASSTSYSQPPIPETPVESAESAEQTSSEAEKEENKGLDLGLSEMVDTGIISESWAHSLNQFLEKYNLSSSTLGKGIATVATIIIFLLLFYILKKIIQKLMLRIKNSSAKLNITFKRTNFYLTCINNLLFLLLACVFMMLTVSIWQQNTEDSLVFQKSSAAFQFLATLGFLFVVGAIAYETVTALMERIFNKWSDTDSARVQTLLPIARNAVNIAVFILLGITIISELGINIMPLLAGAGVIGFAIGFGAQTIIKDLITGFIIIFEDLVQVGDVVTVGGKSGLVEKITIRKIQLRSLDGVVFTVPFSEITIVENMTKEYSYYLFNVGIAYRESPDEVIEVLKSIGEEMQNDENYKNLILDPIEILGVDSFADSAIIIKARIKTQPIKQWQIGREFNRRMKYRFDEAGIEIPFPHQTIYFGEDKDGTAPAARIELQKLESANEDDIDEKSNQESSQSEQEHKSMLNEEGFKDDADNEN